MQPKKKTTTKPKVSPYASFQDWLFSPVPDLPFPEECIKGINPRAVLSSLGKLDGVTIYLDEHFNNFRLMNLDPLEFYKFIKLNIIKKFRVGKYDLSFFKNEKSDKNLKEISKNFPYLKSYEIPLLFEAMKDDPEYDQFMDSLGLLEMKKKKMTKDQKKTFENIPKNMNINTKELENIQPEPYYFKYPEWLFDKNIRLIDIQRLTDRNEIIFNFRDKETNTKKYHTASLSESYYYKNNTPFFDSDMIVDIKDVGLVLDKPQYLTKKTVGYYESDVRTESKHSIDYYYQRTKLGIEEAIIPLNIMFFDIEVFNKMRKEFPDPVKALAAINAISFKMNSEQSEVYIAKLPEMDQTEVNIEGDFKLTFFDTEKDLLIAFCKVLQEKSPDIVAGWNTSSFDWPTIFGRMKYNQIPINQLSPLNKSYFNVRKHGDFYVAGMHLLDQMELYQELSYSVEESYALKAVCKKVLKDQNKVAYEGSLDELYMNDINTFLMYSGTDTDLLYSLEKQLGHIDLKNELRQICSTTWKVSENTTGLVDPLLISFAKNSGLICRDSANIKDGRKIVGAYVRSPIAGLSSWLIDFDYTALYPSIIMSCNVGPNTYMAKIDGGIAEDYIYSKDGLKNVKTIEVRHEPLKQSGITEQMTLNQFREWMIKHNYIITIAGSIYKSQSEELSFLYKILRYTLDSRAKYVELQSQAKRDKDEEMTKFYKNKQMAFKVVSNSIYGVLAASSFRFFAPDLAETITLTGQESIKFIGQHISNYMCNGGDEVDINFLDDYDTKKIPYLIYTDTDSLFLGIGEYLMDKGKL